MQVERLKKEHYEEFMDLIDFVFCRNLRVSRVFLDTQTFSHLTYSM